MTDWIEWRGGECPVAGEALVELRLRDGSVSRKLPASYFRWHLADPRAGEVESADIVAYRLANPSGRSALATQPGGTHYRDCKIQPVEFIEANRLQFLEGSIVKRAARHDKPTGKGREDIEKIIHEARLLLELRYGGAE